ncbi:MAG TPA: hypothetical protein VGH82_10315 [Gaiellaceae bacterium]
MDASLPGAGSGRAGPPSFYVFAISPAATRCQAQWLPSSVIAHAHVCATALDAELAEATTPISMLSALEGDDLDCLRKPPSIFVPKP